MNAEEQLKILEEFRFNDELLSFPLERSRDEEYFYNNSKFGPGDAEYWYNMIRAFKPSRIVEIGWGHATKMALNNSAKNQRLRLAREEHIACNGQ